MGTTPLAPGSVFAGDFEVIRLLADGGMGSVYVVEQRSTGKRRALKVMHPRMLHDPTLRERFTQEARLGAKIASDHVVEVVGAGVDAETGIPWMAMELLQGRDLSAALAERGAFSLLEAKGILRQVGHALSRAHRQGIVHRDLKPENLFLADTKHEGAGAMVKILDFGIAKVMQETRATGATIGGLGTPLWMAPEQTHGGKITPATDVWALGLIGFALLAGRSYWRCGADDVPLTVVLTEMFAAPLVAASERVAELGLSTRLPTGFDQWFAQCVAREASERFVSAEPCIAAFLALGASSAVAASPTMVGAPSVPAGPLPASPKRRRGWAPALVAAAVLLPALGLGAWIAARPPSRDVAARLAPTRAAVAESQRATDEPPPAPVVASEPPAPAPAAAAAPASQRTEPPVRLPRRAAVTPRRATPRARPADPPTVPAWSAVREAPEAPAPSYVPPPPVAPQPSYVPPPVAPQPSYVPHAPEYPQHAPVAVPSHPQPTPAPASGPSCAPCAQGMTERCNGCDDNCNGMVDEGC
ncbi:MAG: protein kinase [Deltaproteobacteria bacterium]|nr:protein kinase [Deltaproteobacteria bacterium]